ncbi:MAG TPA: YetF domain-containing protein [Verrucomicrobiae bacterium]|nr:YetF domain-containing protein [Verrucomicrobiae bacterium]
MQQSLDKILGLGLSGTQLSFEQMLLRGIIVVIAMLVMMRVAGRRFIAQRNPVDTLLGFLIASMLSRDINGSTAFWPTLGLGFVLAICYRVGGMITCRSHTLGRWIKGEAHVLVDNGKVNKAMMLRHGVSEHDLMEDLRLNGGVDDVRKVESACIERNGEISVQRKPEIFTTTVEQSVQTVKIQVT